MQADRNIELHAQFGTYYRFRIPRVGRDISYHPSSCEMLMVGSSSEVYRFNLEQGMFRKPIVTRSPNCEAINSIRINPVHQLFGIGCDNGWVECIDPRSKTVAGILNTCEYIREASGYASSCGNEITCFEFDSNGVTFAAGTNKGQVGIFDLRKSGVIYVRNHNYELPIVSMGFHDLTKNILTADKKLVKLWDKETGNILTNLEMPAQISDALFIPSSGMMMIAGERAKIKTLYIPTLGPAPKWCSFVETITEELEEIKKFSVYQDLKYVTVEELQELGMQDLLGTDLLRPHLHGFFMKMSLYKKALEFYKQSSVTEGNGNDTTANNSANVINTKTDEEIEKETNQILRRNRVEKLMAYLNNTEEEDVEKKDENDSGKKKTNKKNGKQKNESEEKIKTIDDVRFNDLFNDPDFAHDEEEASRVRKRPKTDKKKKEAAEVQVHALQTGQTISYKDSDLHIKPSELAKEKKKTLAERIAENSKQTKNYSISNLRGNKEMVYKDASE
jgi:ribosome biogenesis protein ENP2